MAHGQSLMLHLLAESTTYFSLHVWNRNQDTPGLTWNPGNQDPAIGKSIWEYLKGLYREIPKGSSLWEKLDYVLYDLLSSTSAMEYGSKVNWFDEAPLTETSKHGEAND